ncbi:MAG: YraN family protein [bacterium]|nr:YraN family protein [bacterium]MCY3890402.1 YraN family protein [bacterium]MCY3960723.1 YraN family protein [bacterium]MCY4135900.1 YraN family protein [bacterium]
MAYRQALGRWGEDRVVRWYRRQGFQVLDRNWRCSRGELDVIVQRGSIVAVCEVKTRTSLAFGTPAEAVGWQKQRRIRRLAAQWLAEQERSGPVQLRFDVAEVMGRELRVIEAAF